MTPSLLWSTFNLDGLPSLLIADSRKMQHCTTAFSLTNQSVYILHLEVQPLLGFCRMIGYHVLFPLFWDCNIKIIQCFKRETRVHIWYSFSSSKPFIYKNSFEDDKDFTICVIFCFCSFFRPLFLLSFPDFYMKV